MSEAQEIKKIVRELETDAAGVLLPFSTKKHKYNIIRPGEPIGIDRFTQWERLKIVMGMGRTFTDLVDALNGVEKLLGSDKPLAEVRVEAILSINSLRRGIVDMSKERYSQALYLATIFIYRDGDDPLKWDMNTATDMIDDWREAGLSELDFFQFSALTINGFRERFQKLTEQIRAEEKRLSGITTSIIREDTPSPQTV